VIPGPGLLIIYGLFLLTLYINYLGSFSDERMAWIEVTWFVLLISFLYVETSALNARDTDVFGQRVGLSCSDEIRCKCSLKNGYIYADCSHLQLQKCPNFYNNVREITLESNLLREFQADGKIPDAVVYLNLANNLLSRFHDESFKRLHNLTHLDLNNNYLDYTSSTFNENTLKPLLSLKTLNIQNNVNISTQFKNYPTALTAIVSLQKLYIDGIEKAEFSVEFRKLKNLISLSMSGLTGRCYMSILRHKYFANLPHLKYLDLSYCNLRHVENGSLQLHELQFVNISHNKRLTFNVFSNMTYDLQFTKIEVLDASKLHCTYGPGTTVYQEDVMYLRNTSIRRLIFDSNRLCMIEPTVISLLPPTLEVLSVIDNQFTMGMYIFYLTHLVGLKTLDGSDANSEHVPTLDTNLNESCLDWRPPRKWNRNSWIGIGETQYDLIDKKGNGLSIITIGLPPLLENFIFKSGGLNYEIPAISFSKNNSMHEK